MSAARLQELLGLSDEELLAASAVEGKVPKLGLRVSVDEVFTRISSALEGVARS